VPKGERLPIVLEDLPGAPIHKLRLLWAHHIGPSRPPATRCLIIRELAWYLQSRAHGWIDRPTQRLLDAAVRRALSGRERLDGARAAVSKQSERALSRAVPLTDTPDAAPSSPRRARRAAAPALSTATRLVRVWRGVEHHVEVLAKDRFRYRNSTYGSLSEVARVITGTRWSGPRFFGIVRGHPDESGAGDDR
jgi:hypothetical protein